MDSVSNSQRSEITRHDNIVVPVTDGEVAMTRFEPVDIDEELPVVLLAVPYRKDDYYLYSNYIKTVEYLAKSGYEVVVMDLIGTGASRGAKQSFLGNESDEIVEVIEWLADRPWSTGDVGMFGFSYHGLTQLQTAAAGAESLKAIVPGAISHSPYTLNYERGAYSSLLFTMWYTYMAAGRALPPSVRDDDGRWADVWKDRLEDLRTEEPWFFQALDHPTHDSFWEARDVDVSQIDTPTLAWVGYRDNNDPDAVVEWFDEIDAPKRLIVGPWRHTLPHEGRETAIDFRRQAVEWFDHYLKGIDNGAMDHPTISYWTERDGGWKIDGGVWRAADDWPTVDSHPTLTYALTGDGVVPQSEFTEQSLRKRYEFDHSVGMYSLEKLKAIETTGEDAYLDDARSLVFETDPFSTPVELTGTPVMNVQLESTTPDPLVAVRVRDVSPDGEVRPVTTGFINGRYQNVESVAKGSEFANPQDLEPNTEQSVLIPLPPRSHIFESGHRMRIAISASHFPRAHPPRNHGSFEVLSTPDSPSLLEFPGRELTGDLDDTIEMQSPDMSLPIENEYLQSSEADLDIVYDRINDTSTFDWRAMTVTDLPHANYFEWDHEVTATVGNADPTDLAIRNVVTAVLDYDYEQVRVTSESRHSHETTILSLRAEIDSDVMLDKQWVR